MSQVIIIENGSIDVVTKNGLSLTEVSSALQKKKGTVILSLEFEGKQWLFGSYRSGMVRKLPSKSSKCGGLYQLNRVIKIKKIYFWQGKKYPGESSKRILIPDAIDRLNYLMEYIDRNYGYYFRGDKVELVSLTEKRRIKSC